MKNRFERFSRWACCWGCPAVSRPAAGIPDHEAPDPEEGPAPPREDQGRFRPLPQAQGAGPDLRGRISPRSRRPTSRPRSTTSRPSSTSWAARPASRWPARSSSRTRAARNSSASPCATPPRSSRSWTTSTSSAEDLFPLDFMKELKDVSVSLKSEGKIVSDPYEKTIASPAPRDRAGRDLPAPQGRREPRRQRLLLGQDRDDVRLPPEGRQRQHRDHQLGPVLPGGRPGEHGHLRPVAGEVLAARPTSSSSRSSTCPTRSTTSSATRRRAPGCPRSSSPRASPA